MEHENLMKEILARQSKMIDDGTFNDKNLIFDKNINLTDFENIIKNLKDLNARTSSKKDVSSYTYQKPVKDYEDHYFCHPWALLHYAIYYCYYDKAEILLKNGADINLRRYESDDPPFMLMGGFWSSKTNMIDLCIKYGVDINYSNDGGWTILHKCGSTSSFEFYKTLINRDADINKRVKHNDYSLGLLPIHTCISPASSIEDNLEKFKYLITLQPELKKELKEYIKNMKFISDENKKKFIEILK